jgi:hypothetical protein
MMGGHVYYELMVVNTQSGIIILTLRHDLSGWTSCKFGLNLPLLFIPTLPYRFLSNVPLFGPHCLGTFMAMESWHLLRMLYIFGLLWPFLVLVNPSCWSPAPCTCTYEPFHCCLCLIISQTFSVLSSC